MFALNKSMHMYVIPTNRECGENIVSLLDEVRMICEKMNIEFIIVLLDSSIGAVSQKNRYIYKEYCQRYEMLNCYYISQKKFDYYVKNLLESYKFEKDDIELLIGDGISYGKVVNRTSLIATMLGCEYIHRRDSDTRLQYLDSGVILAPLELEMKYLGKTSKDIPNGSSNNIIYMVGGSYKGNWGIDYEDLRNQKEQLYSLFRLSKPTWKKEKLEKYINDKYIYGCNENYLVDEISFEKNGYIDVGNFSLYDIFKKCPVSPAMLTSGTDYFYHSLLNKLPNSKLYHNRRVIHKYDNKRYSDITIENYHLSKAQARCATLFENYLFDSNNKLDINSEHISVNLGKRLMELAYYDCDHELIRILESMITTYAKTDMDKYIRCAKYINENKNKIIKNTKRDILYFGKLCMMWSELISIFQEQKIDNFIIS